MVTLRNQKCTKVKVSKTSPIEEKIIPLKKRPRGRPRKHPIVKSPVLKTLLIPQNATGKNEENSLNRPMKKEYVVNDINISTVFEKTFPNATREAPDLNDEELQWNRDVDHMQFREAIGQEFLEYCHLISLLEEEYQNMNSATKLKTHHEKLLHILIKAGVD